MLIYIILFSTVVFTLIAILSRGSTFDGLRSDAHKQVIAASRFSEWRWWPSGMHKFAGGKAWMKELGVLFLVPFQRILNDNIGFYPVVMVSNLGHAISGVLIFLITQNYWGNEAGLFLFLLYMFCFWPYMIILHGGLQVLAQMCFLLSIYCLQQIDDSSTLSNWIWSFGGGSCFALVNFSSASGRKFISLYVVAVAYHLSGKETNPWIIDNPGNFINYGFYTVIISLLLILMLIVFLWGRNYLIAEWLFKYQETIIRPDSPGKIHSIEKINKRLNDYLPRLKILIGFFVIVLIILMLYLRSNEDYILFCLNFLGILLISTYLILPNLYNNLRGYLSYWFIESDWGSHYAIYVDYFQNNYGKVFKKGKEGWLWYLKFFWRFVPFVFLLYIFSLIMIFMGIAVTEERQYGLLLLPIISLLPIMWGEFTTGPKALLPMYTTLIPLFLPVGYMINQIFELQIDLLKIDLKIILWSLLFAHCLWNIYIFFADILPSRMSTAKIIKELDKLNVNKIYTYKTKFNYPFIEIINEFYTEKYKIEYLSSLDKINEGYFFVPCTSAKAAYFQSASDIGPVGDFTDDEKLNELISSKEIQKYSVARFKTFGSSSYWQQLGNVVSFRDLILSEISSKDKFRGFAWLLKF